MRTCEICGAKLRSWQKYTCSIECSTVRTRNTHSLTKSPYKELKVEKYTPQRMRCIETDSDQIAIKKAIDARYGIGHDAGRSLLATDEWEEVVKTITPIERVPNRRAMPVLAPSKWRAGGIGA